MPYMLSTRTCIYRKMVLKHVKYRFMHSLKMNIYEKHINVPAFKQAYTYTCIRVHEK